MSFLGDIITTDNLYANNITNSSLNVKDIFADGSIGVVSGSFKLQDTSILYIKRGIIVDIKKG
jgi:hypothetical protein